MMIIHSRPPSKGTILRWLITLILIILLLNWVGSENVVNSIITADLLLLSAAIMIHLFATSFTAWRIKFLLPKKTNIPFWRFFTCNIGGMFLSDFTPARSGYFLIPLLLKRYGVPQNESMRAILFGQVFDFVLRIVLLLIAGIIITLGFIGYKEGSSLVINFFLAFSVLIIITFIFLVLALDLIPKPIQDIILRIPIMGSVYQAYGTYSKTYSPNKRTWIGATIITIIGWLMTAFRWFLVAESLGLNIPPIWFLFIFPAISAMSFIPLTIAGAGIVETGYGVTFWLLGEKVENAIIFGILDRVASIFGDTFGLYELITFSALGKTELKPLNSDNSEYTP